MVTDEIETSDEFEQGQERTLSINEIILRHIRKISDICCKEFTGGFWEKKPVRTANGVLFAEYWHEDVREAYCNSVDFLIDIIYPKGDKGLKDYLKEFEGYKDVITTINKEDILKENTIDIKTKLQLKRQTFRQINLMFERMNFWTGTGTSNE